MKVNGDQVSGLGNWVEVKARGGFLPPLHAPTMLQVQC
jgi:hypothetical protein